MLLGAIALSQEDEEKVPEVLNEAIEPEYVVEYKTLHQRQRQPASSSPSNPMLCIIELLIIDESLIHLH